MFSEQFISLSDIYLAYRKAKSEAFYDNLHPSAISYVEFERSLQKNIESIYQLITNGSSEWWQSKDLIGGHLYVPKSLDDSPWNNIESAHFRSIDPNLDWEQRFSDNNKLRLEAKYRLIITPTVAFQIISALWIIKAGHKFEEKLDKNLSFGNRLRRKKHALEDFGPFNGPVNEDSSGLFSPYFSAYRNWRQKGLDTMQQLVKAGGSVTAITMDLAGFYHNASPNFLLKPSFLKAINVTLSPDEFKFTQLILKSIEYWYKQTPDFMDRPEGALPVGLSASKVISNVLLFELDQQIQSGINPAYYGRYVDDIFLVINTPDSSPSGNQVLEFISKNVKCIKIDRAAGKPPGLKIKFNYASDSDLRFTASKQKIFSLSSEHGLDLINQISSQIRAQSSEYRMLPEVPRSSAEMADKALLASSDASLIADALRKADVVSIKRLGLSLLIRDIESYSSDLARPEWMELRTQFYGLAHRYLVTPRGLFELFGYYKRVFSLMVSNYDFSEAEKFITNLYSCFDLIQKTTTQEKGRAQRIHLCKAYFEKVLLQASLQAAGAKNFDKWPQLRLLLKKLFDHSDSHRIDIKKKNLKALTESFLLADLGGRPYKEYWYYGQDQDIRKARVPRSIDVRRVLRLASIRKFQKSADLKLPHWPALAFPTRPLNVQEIALISPATLDDNLLFRRSIWGLRGAKVRTNSFIGRNIGDDGYYISIPAKKKEKTYVALTNFETTVRQFQGALAKEPDRSLIRYEKVNRLINSILRASRQSDYVVFPECSLPRRWAMSVAAKLAQQGISLIAGIEYYDHKNGGRIIRNDSLVSLATRWPGYPSNIVFMQPKLRPSHGEAELIRKAKARQYIPKKENEILPIYEHGKFHFGVLICSDMTNPENRVRFQGKVDGLFVLEWNPDVKTFSFLVEGAAHDVHAFIVQVNNRLYGDSRVRAPYRVEHMRDSVRIKGGIEDYFVIAELDFNSLRKFQRKRNMNDKEAVFKPTPIGFKMSPRRKR
ncbi:TPA: hypothetical protein N0J77_000262 [Pseudomonas aeruginosa]|uniref:hypothetical protein n=1 Tax=Pseudomonas aeruginosa TaxID=287 RepID=UPI000D368F4E|nr:hypothetical protein [Pseudomonas aeruginosa]PTZ95738.1 hypothetical protein DB380_22145 [Pseudomonas aeruginosa]RQG19122.1 hypothetical protein IPC205_27365 [Pseudomonas aeruginosa]WOJ13694.1 hypothetical protein M0M55_05975 [Pseudomonas aeruginosa]HCK4322566.1 hypothetical protein [Pseudomonas aeruginosa]HCK5620814.1 hypothetical protein [Pseudomonas aeruginosa]